MDKKESYYLMPGNAIGKQGLPGNKLECKSGKEPLKIDPKYFGILEPTIDFLIADKSGKVLTGAALKAKEEAEAKLAEASGKSEKRLSLEAEAKELGLDFDDKTSQKDLSAMIEEKKLEMATEPDGDSN